MQHGGKLLADEMARHGVRRVFSVPGESFLALLDGLLDTDIVNIACRHEGGAAMMAEAQGKMTGLPGIAMVTRGPGAANAAAGLHVARQDSTPMILLVGQIARDNKDREAFQEVDYRAAFGGLVKWVGEVGQPERLPEYFARAWHIAQSGRPGPVLLALPEDVLTAQVEPRLSLPAKAAQPKPDLTKTARDVLRWLAPAKNPLVIVGGPHWSAAAEAALARFASVQGLPVALGFRRQDYLDNRSPNYAGDLGVAVNPTLGARLKNADALLLLGTRLGDIETQGYTLAAPGHHSQRICHIHVSADELGQVWQPELAVTARADHFVEALAELPQANPSWQVKTTLANTERAAWQKLRPTPGKVQLEQIIGWLSANLPDDAIITNGAGNYAAWLHRYFLYKGYQTQLAPTSGSMGYGFPAAIAASLEYPSKTVVCLAGDGCFQMTLNELSTAAQHGAKPIVVVANNGRYGTIRTHQERHYPGRVSGTDLANPDFAKLAQAYGAYGETVSQTADFPAAFARAQAANSAAIIELMLDPEALTPGKTLTEIRAAAQAD
ncbi:MAG: thiamine pyrophosphate-binding protein [Rhodobacteraceae bacterium]|nr:thiamine pyrophosphate-binding protein [Paracoccaceae bacterium]